MLKLKLHCLTCSWQIDQQMKDDCGREEANKLIVISSVTFETMKKFIRFRVRRVLMHFICYMPSNIYSWILLPSKGADGEIIKKNTASPQFTT